MFCPICGTESTRGLNYCNRCGANLSLPPGAAGPKPVVPKLTGMFWGITLLSLFGIIGIFAAISDNAERLPPQFYAGVLTVACGTVVAIVAMLIWLLLRITGLSPSRVRRPEREQPTLAAQPPAQLSAPAGPFGSVTENTTRNFQSAGASEPAKVERTGSSE